MPRQPDAMSYSRHRLVSSRSKAIISALIRSYLVKALEALFKISVTFILLKHIIFNPDEPGEHGFDSH